VALAGSFDGGYDGVAGSPEVAFAPAFIGSVLLVASNPLSFGAFLGDWSRYVPRGASRRRLMGAAFWGQLATILPFAFGLFTSVAIVEAAGPFAADGNYAGGLVAAAPDWFLIPVCLIAVIGGLAAGTTALYGPGLDFSSLVPRLSRFQSTVVIGVAAIGVIFLGRFVWSFVDTILVFATLIIVCNVPWVVVMTIGFVTRRGWYSPDDLQVFNRGQRGGIYWFERGVRWPALIAWIVPTAVALLFVNLPGQFEGPLRDVAADVGIADLAGVDLSLAVALVLSTVLYVTLTWLWPEPRAAFGTGGPRWVRTTDAAPAPIEQVRQPQLHAEPEPETLRVPG
jgi:purine-cytosine permease-like protein